MRNETYCIDWSLNATAKQLIHEKLDLADPCPCMEQLMQFEYSFREVPHWYLDPVKQQTRFKIVCYKQWFPNYNGVIQECCYS